MPGSSTCPSTTSCAKSLEPKPETHTAPLAGVVTVRCQFGTLTVKWVRLLPYDGGAGNTLTLPAKSKRHQPLHSATIRTRQFGTKLRRQRLQEELPSKSNGLLAWYDRNPDRTYDRTSRNGGAGDQRGKFIPEK